jgi:hypothetical protein
MSIVRLSQRVPLAYPYCKDCKSHIHLDEVDIVVESSDHGRYLIVSCVWIDERVPHPAPR